VDLVALVGVDERVAPVPGGGPRRLAPGDSLRASFTLQLQPARVLATRLGVHGRLDSTGELDGEPVKRSGGASVFVAPELVASPTRTSW